jgi:ComF family protein
VSLHPSIPGPICAECKSGIPVNDGRNCLTCARPFEGVTPDETGIYCGECRINPPPFEKTVYSLYYNDAVRDLIHHFKFKGRDGIAKTFAGLMSAKIHKELDIKKIDLIIPLPLHVKRLYDRGYNQSYLLASEIGSAFSKDVMADILIKTINTKPQSSLSGRERRNNLKNAFAVRYQEKVIGKNILLIDDIMTTGTTLIEASKVLKKAKVKSIACAVAARA